MNPSHSQCSRKSGRSGESAARSSERERLPHREHIQVRPARAGRPTFGEKLLTAITTDDIEAFRDSRKAAGLSAVTVNHDLKLLRKMLNWGIRKGYLERSPFKIGTEAGDPT